MIFFLFFLYYT